MSDTGFWENLSVMESKLYCEKVFAFDTENIQASKCSNIYLQYTKNQLFILVGTVTNYDHSQ